jgi:hypothetical protein
VATLKHRLEQLEHAFLPRRRREVRDVTELTNVELSLELLDGFAALSDPSIATIRADICAKQWLEDGSLTDPMERFAAHLLRTVIWGHNSDSLDGATRDAAPMLAEQYRGLFPERVFAVARKAPPWHAEAHRPLGSN